MRQFAELVTTLGTSTKTNEKLDKDRFRFDLGKVDEAYQEVRTRILGNQKTA